MEILRRFVTNGKMRLLALSGLALWFAGCTTAGLMTSVAEQGGVAGGEERARSVLEELRETYVNEDLERFFDLMSDGAALNVTDLKFRLMDRFRNSSQIELNFFEDHALTEGSKAVLQTHWQRRMVNDGTGGVETSEGNAQFIFEDGGNVRLFSIQGDNPFS